MIETLVTMKDFVKRNQTKILVGALAVTTAVVAMQRANLRDHDDFLKEHDLYKTYYYFDEAWLNPTEI